MEQRSIIHHDVLIELSNKLITKYLQYFFQELNILD